MRAEFVVYESFLCDYNSEGTGEGLLIHLLCLQTNKSSYLK